MSLQPGPNTFTWPAQRGTLSKNIKAPKNWQDEGILYPHEMFRWYFSEIREIFKCSDGEETIWKAKMFSKWIARVLLDSIHHHHESEEQLYNPLILSKGGKLPPSIEGDHTSLMEGIAKAKVILAKIDDGKGILAAYKEFKVFFENWMVTCESHFDGEEIQYPEQLKATNITQEEEKAVVNQIIQSIGLEGNKIMLPPICYAICLWGGEAKMQEFYTTLPPPIQFLCQKCWLDDFWVNNLRVINALKTPGSEEYIPETPVCGVCSVQ